MEIYKKDFFKVFEKNFNYKIVDTKLGKAIVMPPKDAFIYSCVTGAGYLENPVYPFTPKGLVKLFYNAFDYKFVTGIFDNTTLKNTPYIFSKAKKYLFEGDKYVVPIEFDSEVELNDYLQEKFNLLEKPEDYLIQRIEKSKNGNGMEPFMEFLTADFFKKRGYIVETQIPLAHSIGSPDFGGYGLAKSIKLIQDYNLLPSGFHIIELAMLRLFKVANSEKSLAENKLIVGEAKTGNSQAVKQLEKYLDTNLFDYGFEIFPYKKEPSKDYLGLVTIDDDYSVKTMFPKNAYEAKKPLPKEDYLKWLDNYIKFYLIANLTDDELTEFYKNKNSSAISGQKDIINFVTNLDTDEIINFIIKL